MQAFQQRVIEEEADLRSKIEKLQAFVVGNIFHALGADEQDRMKRQLKHMLGYVNVLVERIKEFA